MFNQEFLSAASVVKTLIDEVQVRTLGAMLDAASTAGYGAVDIEIGGYFTFNNPDRRPHIADVEGIESTVEQRTNVGQIDKRNCGRYIMTAGVDADPSAIYHELKQHRDECVREAKEARAFDKTTAS